MRSKEVDEAIKRIDYLQQDLCSCEECQLNKKAYNTIFAYIEELEEENKVQRGQLNSAFDNGFIHKDKIRDKIKELDEDKQKYIGYKGLEFSRTGVINSQIQVLKSIIGE